MEVIWCKIGSQYAEAATSVRTQLHLFIMLKGGID